MTTLSPLKRLENRQRAAKYRGHQASHGLTIGAAIDSALQNPGFDYVATVGSDEQMKSNLAYGGALVPIGTIADPFGRPILTPSEMFVTEVEMTLPQTTIPARTDDDHSTGSVTGGLSFSTRAESFATTASRIETEQVTIDSYINSAAVYLTQELLDDGPGVRKLLEQAAFDEMRAEKERQRFSGTGVGEGEGIINSNPATINVSRQTGNNITEQDVKAMRKRCFNYAASAWYANPDTITELEELYITFSTLGAAPMLTHSGGQAFLSGRPLYLTERCSALGTAGDLVLADFSQMVEGNYSQETVESIHVRFIEHESILRFSFRYDCRSLWRAALTPENGANTLSPFVVLN